MEQKNKKEKVRFIPCPEGIQTYRYHRTNRDAYRKHRLPKR